MTKIMVIADGPAGHWLLVNLCEDAEGRCNCACAVDKFETSLLFLDENWLDRTFSDDPQRLSSSGDFLWNCSFCDTTGHLAQPKPNLIIDPLRLNQSCAKVFVGVDEPNPSIAMEPINRFLVQKRDTCIISETCIWPITKNCVPCSSRTGFSISTRHIFNCVMRAWRVPAPKVIASWTNQKSPIVATMQTTYFPALWTWAKHVCTDLSLAFSCYLLKTVHEQRRTPACLPPECSSCCVATACGHRQWCWAVPRKR